MSLNASNKSQFLTSWSLCKTRVPEKDGITGTGRM